MKQKYKFSGFELFFLTVNLIIYKSFTDIPRRFLEASGSAAFLSAFISGILVYIFIWFLPVIYRETKTDNIIDLIRKYVSKAFSSVVGIIISAYIILSVATALKGVSVFSMLSAYPLSPFVFVALFFIIAACLAVFRGMDAVIRVHSIIVPFCIVVTLVMLPAVFGSADVQNLFPLFGKGVYSVFSSAFKNVSYYFDFILLFLLNPFYGGEKSSVRIIRISGAAGILINLFIILSANLILPYPVPNEVKFPLYQIMKTVYFGRFFQRIDAIYLLSVALSGMAYISFGVFLVTVTLKKSLFLYASRPLAPAVSLIVLFLALGIYKNIIPSVNILKTVLEIITIVLITFIPFIKLGKKEGELKG